MEPENNINANLEDLRYKIRNSIGGQNKITLGKFILLERLGGGNYGDVYKAIHQQNQKYFAIKIIDKEMLFKKNKDEYIRTVLKRLL
jgi:serine/threonine protein kinase